METFVTASQTQRQASGASAWPRVVIFDLDGVIIDSSAVMREAFAIAYAEVVGAGEVPFAEYQRYLGRYFPDIMRLMGLPLAMEEPFVRESYRLAHRIQLFDGVEEMLRTLRTRGLRMAIATGKAGARARSVLSGLDVLPLFDYVIGSDEVARAKPAPDIVVKALRLLEVQPSESVMVGDALSDLASARSAGVTAIAALWGTTEEPSVLCGHADAALGQPTDLLALCTAVTSGRERS